MATERVVEGEVPVRLDRVVVDLKDVGSRSRARRVVEEGKISVDGRVVSDAGAMVEPGQRVAIDWSRRGTAREKVAAKRGMRDAGLRVLYEDERLLALDKPVGLLTDTATRDQARNRDSLRKQARRYLKASGRDAFVVHRIDRDTTGVVLLAKDDAASEHLRSQFRGQRPTRVYDAIVYGPVRDDEAHWADWMAWDRGRRLQRVVPPEHPDAFHAEADMRVVRRYRRATQIEVSLQSGRRNQIRLQAMLRGHPLVGERLYLPEGWRVPASPRLERQALHARRLVVAHPDDERALTIEAPWPDDIRRLARGLEED